MLGRTAGAVLVGVEARLVEVEVHLGGGLPNIAAVGLANSSVREGIDRIRAALLHSGFKLPQRRVTINLAPADVRKEGAALDLPIAAAILAADGRLGSAPARDIVLAGGLAPDGPGAAPGDPPAALARGGPRGDSHVERRRLGKRARAPPSLPRAPPRRVLGGADRRRSGIATRRDRARERRCFVSRRADGIPPRCARGAAPALGERRRGDRTPPFPGGVPGAVHARRVDESVFVRLARRSAFALPLHAARGAA